MSKLKCSDCGSEDVMTNLNIADHSHYQVVNLSILLHKFPDSWTYKGTKRATLKATVCADCGKIDLKVDNARALWDIYQQQNNNE